MVVELIIIRNLSFWAVVLWVRGLPLRQPVMAIPTSTAITMTVQASFQKFNALNSCPTSASNPN